MANSFEWLTVEPAQIPSVLNHRMKGLVDFLKKVPRHPVLAGELGVKDTTYGYGDVRRYGAVGDGAIDDTTAIQNAIEAAADVEGVGGIVRIPAGVFLTGKITMRRSITVQGAGINPSLDGSSILKLKPATNDHLIDLSDPACNFVTIRDLTLNGNSGNQTVGADSNGINGYRATATGSGSGRHYIDNVVIKGFAGHGVYFGGNVNDSRFDRVDISFCDGHGFFLFGGDYYLTGCISSFNGGAGFYSTGVGYQFAACKAYLNGDTLGGFLSIWPGFIFRGAKGCVVAGCSSQENYGDGFYLYQSYAINIQALADGNGVTASSGAASPQAYDGVVLLDSDDCVVNVTCDDFRRRVDASYKNQRYGVRIDNLSTNCTVVASVDNHDAGNEVNYSTSSPMSHTVVCNGRVLTVPLFPETLTDVSTTAKAFGITYLDPATTYTQGNLTIVPAAGTIKMFRTISAGAAAAVVISTHESGSNISVTMSVVGDTLVLMSDGVKWVTLHTSGALQGERTWDPGSLVDGAGETSLETTVNGAAFGDFAMVAPPYDLQGITCTAYVNAANRVTIRLQNETGGTIDLASGSWRVRVIKGANF